jgi:hypothetical protein
LKRLALNDFVADFVANLYSIESKIPYTLKSLFTKPGKAAKEFTVGKKAFYANPFRFYLSVTLIYFLFSGLFDKFNAPQSDAENRKTSSEIAAQRNFSENAIQLDIDTTEQEKTKKRYSEAELLKLGYFKSMALRLEMYQDYISIAKNDTLSDAEALKNLGHVKNRSNLFLYDRARKINEMKNKDSRYAFLDYLKSNMPLILFLTLPFFGLAFWLLYFRKKNTFAEHLVFVFYTASYFSIWLMVWLLIYQFTGLNLSWLLAFVFPIYMFLALRRFYNQAVLKTLLKMVLLVFLLSVQLVISTLFVLLLAFVTY